MNRVASFVLLAGLLAAPVAAKRTKLTPGFNIFTPAQDVEMGRKVAKQAESQVELLAEPTATAYLETLGQQLVTCAPGGDQFSFIFKIVNDHATNAFGLPGGFVYVNRGTIESAANEAQLASVIAHEVGHVVLRHSTHELSNAYVLQAPVSTLGAIGRTPVDVILARIDGGFTANSVLMRNTKEDEAQADLIGTQIIYDAGYDPRAMSQFLKTLEATKQFFTHHPNPSNRIGNVNKEIEKLGGVPPNARLDSAAFQEVKKVITELPTIP